MRRLNAIIGPVVGRGYGDGENVLVQIYRRGTQRMDLLKPSAPLRGAYLFDEAYQFLLNTVHAHHHPV